MRTFVETFVDAIEMEDFERRGYIEDRPFLWFYGRQFVLSELNPQQDDVQSLNEATEKALYSFESSLEFLDDDRELSFNSVLLNEALDMIKDYRNIPPGFVRSVDGWELTRIKGGVHGVCKKA